MPAVQETIDTVRKIDVDQYKYGFESKIEMDKAPKGLNEDIIRLISAKKEEPEWMLEWRLGAYRRWLTLEEPTWARVNYPKIDFQDIHYYAAPKSTPGPTSLAEVDPELLKTYAKLGIPLKEQEILAGVQKQPTDELDEANDNVYKSGRVAVDAVFDSVSVVTTDTESNTASTATRRGPALSLASSSESAGAACFFTPARISCSLSGMPSLA